MLAELRAVGTFDLVFAAASLHWPEPQGRWVPGRCPAQPGRCAEPVRVQPLEQISRVLPEQVTTVTDPTVHLARLT